MQIIVDTIEKNDNVSRAQEVVDCTDSDIVWSRWVTTVYVMVVAVCNKCDLVFHKKSAVS